MKIGFIGLPSPGHLNPMSALARQLQSRNHDVVVLSVPAAEARARAANLPFVFFGEKEFPVDKTAEVIRKLGSLKGEEGLQFTVGSPDIDCGNWGKKQPVFHILLCIDTNIAGNARRSRHRSSKNRLRYIFE
jgi:hypothetical protein